MIRGNDTEFDDENENDEPVDHPDAGGCPPAVEDSGTAPTEDAGEDAGSLASLSCKIAIIGGGAGGSTPRSGWPTAAGR